MKRLLLITLCAVGLMHCGLGVDCALSDYPSIKVEVGNATDSSGGEKALNKCEAKVVARKNGHSYIPKGAITGCMQVASVGSEKATGAKIGQTICWCEYTIWGGTGTFSVEVSRNGFQNQKLLIDVYPRLCPRVLPPKPDTVHKQVMLAPLPVTGG